MSDAGCEPEQEPPIQELPEPDPALLQEYPGARQCYVCDMWLSGPQAYADHVIGKKHKTKLRRRGIQSLPAKIQIPTGTALILEQQALEADAVMRYTLSLYRRAAIRANL